MMESKIKKIQGIIGKFTIYPAISSCDYILYRQYTFKLKHVEGSQLTALFMLAKCWKRCTSPFTGGSFKIWEQTKCICSCRR